MTVTGHRKHVTHRLHNDLGPFDTEQNNGMKFSHDRKNYIDFQLDNLGGGGGGILKTPHGRVASKNRFVCGA